MKDFLFIYRADYINMPESSPEEMQAMTKRWMNWIGGIAAQQKLVDRGNRLERSGTVVRNTDLVTDGPYTEIKESIGGYTVIKAASLAEASEIAKGCPIFMQGGTVEVREISPLS
jgi:hypothetical protein